jgi:hypothetical protein
MLCCLIVNLIGTLGVQYAAANVFAAIYSVRLKVKDCARGSGVSLLQFDCILK